MQINHGMEAQPVEIVQLQYGLAFPCMCIKYILLHEITCEIVAFGLVVLIFNLWLTGSDPLLLSSYCQWYHTRLHAQTVCRKLVSNLSQQYGQGCSGDLMGCPPLQGKLKKEMTNSTCISD